MKIQYYNVIFNLIVLAQFFENHKNKYISVGYMMKHSCKILNNNFAKSWGAWDALINVSQKTVTKNIIYDVDAVQVVLDENYAQITIDKYMDIWPDRRMRTNRS